MSVNDEPRVIDTFAIQLNGRTIMVLRGELRDADDRLGPGGTFTVISAPTSARREDPQVDDRVFLIALPDAPRIIQKNGDRLEQERRGQS